MDLEEDKQPDISLDEPFPWLIAVVSFCFIVLYIYILPLIDMSFIPVINIVGLGISLFFVVRYLSS